MYNDKVLEHFKNPHNVGEMENPDGYAEVGSSECGDTMKMYLRVDDNIITDIKYKTYGCCAAIASSSIATDMAKGRTIEEAEAMTKSDIIKELGGLPEKKIHCSLMAEDALKAAINDYKSRK
ncbi:MAG: iron-sulfur cluster assembly scaffold protein [Eubacteriales bacterium]|nr:iron-sulfur cluster assembly scaffold protein [Eubacteriales bacterium]